MNSTDLVLLSGLGCEREDALELFDYVQRVLATNVSVGEKAIPAELRRRIRPSHLDEAEQAAVIAEADRLILEHYGFTDEELDFRHLLLQGYQ